MLQISCNFSKNLNNINKTKALTILEGTSMDDNIPLSFQAIFEEFDLLLWKTGKQNLHFRTDQPFDPWFEPFFDGTSFLFERLWWNSEVFRKTEMSSALQKAQSGELLYRHCNTTSYEPETSRKGCILYKLRKKIKACGFVAYQDLRVNPRFCLNKVRVSLLINLGQVNSTSTILLYFSRIMFMQKDS